MSKDTFECNLYSVPLIVFSTRWEIIGILTTYPNSHIVVYSTFITTFPPLSRRALILQEMLIPTHRPHFITPKKHTSHHPQSSHPCMQFCLKVLCNAEIQYWLYLLDCLPLLGSSQLWIARPRGGLSPSRRNVSLFKQSNLLSLRKSFVMSSLHHDWRSINVRHKVQKRP